MCTRVVDEKMRVSVHARADMRGRTHRGRAFGTGVAGEQMRVGRHVTEQQTHVGSEVADEPLRVGTVEQVRVVVGDR